MLWKDMMSKLCTMMLHDTVSLCDYIPLTFLACHWLRFSKPLAVIQNFTIVKARFADLVCLSSF